MSYASLHHANKLASAIAGRLAGIGSALTVTQSTGAAGDPLIQVGTGVAGTQTALIRIASPKFQLAANAAGAAQEVYAPSVAQIAVEAGPTQNTAPLLSVVNNAIIMGAVFGMGSRVEVYTSATTVGPTETTLNGTPVATFDLNLKYGLLASI